MVGEVKMRLLCLHRRLHSSNGGSVTQATNKHHNRPTWKTTQGTNALRPGEKTQFLSLLYSTW
jgi:hypothetical protein